MSDRVAVLIVSYNMPERADALYNHIAASAKWPHDIYLIDNGSDQTPPAINTNVNLPKNVQTTGGWLEGLKYAVESREYLAYWFLITSAEFVDGDALSPMAQFLIDNPDAVGIHPSLTQDSTTSWKQLYNRGTNAPRQTWMIDNIASLYRADWFDSIGRFDPKMRYAWGIDLETCWKARKQKRSLWIDDRVRVKKVTNIGYTMNRMGMSANERERLAYANMQAVLYERYGANWWERMTMENVTDAMR